jgi:hypothetical protein
MPHFPRRHRWLLRWLPDRCSCGQGRFDRCPHAVTDVPSRSGAPRAPRVSGFGPAASGGGAAGAGMATSGPPNQSRHEGDDPQSRLGRW